MEVKFDPVLKDINRISKGNKYYLIYKYLIRDLTAVIEKYASGRLLDIGCGNKPYIKLLDGKIIEYVGCDFIQNQAGTVDIICDAGNIPLPDASFESCLSTQVIEHVQEPEKLVSEAFRLLKPGGYFILSGPMYWPVHGEPYDFYRFTRFGYIQMLSSRGFLIEEIKENGGAWATAGQSLLHAFEFSSKRSFFFRMIRFIFFRLRFTWIVNSVYGWMDKKDHNPVNTMNYVIVGRKKLGD